MHTSWLFAMLKGIDRVGYHLVDGYYLVAKEIFNRAARSDV